MWSRGLVIVLVAGCHAGGGPVIGFSRGGVRLGAEASAGVGPLGATIGGTTSITSDEGTRLFATFDPAIGIPAALGSRDGFLGVGGLVGYTTNGGTGGHWATGAWATAAVAPDFCDRGSPVYSVSIGLRELGGITEVFIAPKVNAVTVPCDD